MSAQESPVGTGTREGAGEQPGRCCVGSQGRGPHVRYLKVSAERAHEERRRKGPDTTGTGQHREEDDLKTDDVQELPGQGFENLFLKNSPVNLPCSVSGLCLGRADLTQHVREALKGGRREQRQMCSGASPTRPCRRPPDPAPCKAVSGLN